MAGKVIHAAGGIVVRNGARRLVAVVQRSKDDRWVLPRGKLKATERPVVGAQREVVEETGHRVRVREFLGAITYRARGRPKVVQFWHMQAAARPSHGLMGDIAAVEWLPLKAAIRRLSYPLEKLFLRSVGRRAIPRRKKAARRKKRKAKSLAKSLAKRKARAKTPRPAKRRHARRKTTSKTANKATAKTRATRLRTRKALSASVATAPRAERRGMLQRMLGTLGR